MATANASGALDGLDAQAIQRGIEATGQRAGVEVLETCGSTNTELLSRAAMAEPVLLFAEEQTAGRGRRGRRWHADPQSSLMFSLRWEFAGDAGRLRGLSLACGVAVARALRSLGAHSVSLKWPNDLLASPGKQSAKLGGMLVETKSSGGRIGAVIGIGINCRRMPGLEARLSRAVSSLEECMAKLPPRNEIAAAVGSGLLQAMARFDAAGFEAFRPQWEAMHAHQGEALKVRVADGRVIAGIADGLAPDGALVLRTRRGLQSIHNGTVVRESARARSAA